MNKKELILGDIVKHKASNNVIETMTIYKIETKGINGQTIQEPHYICSFFSPETNDLEYRSFLRHEIEFIKRPKE